MTMLDDFFAKEGRIGALHMSRPLPQWVNDLTTTHEKDSLVKGLVDGRMTALSMGKREMLEAFAAKYGFEYDMPKSDVLLKNMDKNHDR